MPSMFGKDSKKKELIKNLDQTYEKIQREHQISPGDFPDLKRMQVFFHLIFFLVNHLFLLMSNVISLAYFAYILILYVICS